MNHKYFKKFIRLFFGALFFILPSQKVLASHAMGADITYTCLGGNQYQLTFSFYRDCSGITPSSTMSMEINNGCGFPATTVNINQVGLPVDVPTTCPTALTTCHGGIYTGIQHYTYSGIITLPGPCANWTVGHAENARNAAITTITGNGSDNLYVYSMINNTNGLCNNSPTFSNPPVPFACEQQRFCFNHGAYDADGDSLSFQLITPLTNSLGGTVTYLAGYSTSSPIISSSPAFYLDPVSGDICMRPTVSDVSVFAVLVNEYRNGVLIGQVERDIQLTVRNCVNILPDITGINGAPSFNRTICANTPFCFYIRSVDPDALNTTTITWDNSIAGATLVTSGAYRDSAYFCWTPTTADISTSPVCFTVTVKDDNCPYQGVQIRTFCLTVNGVIADAGIDQTISCGATANLMASATLGNGGFNFAWTDGTIGPSHPGTGLGTYIVDVTSGTCHDLDTVNVLPGIGQPVANFSFTNNCSGTPISFSDVSVINGSPITTWSWDFGDGFTSASQNPSHQFAGNGTYGVTLIVATAAGCTDTITRQVTINTNIPFAQFSAPAICAGGGMNFTDQSTGTPTVWAWDFGDAGSASNSSTSQNPSHSFVNGGNYTITLTVTNAAGCQSVSQQNVVVNANPTLAIVDPAICAGTGANIVAPGGYANYNWDNTYFTQAISVTPALTTNYSITITDGNGCTGTDVVTVTVNALPIADAGLDRTICEGTNTTLIGAGGASYAWQPGALIGQNVIVSPSTTTDYVVTVTNAAGCTSSDQVRVSVNAMPIVAASSDQGVCKGESATVSVVNGVGAYTWTPGGFNTASITVTPPITTVYTVVVSDAIGCSGSASVTVVVNPEPNASFSSSGPVCINNSITYTDLSNVSTGTIASWNWNFGNGGTSTNQNASSLYTNSGNFNVELIISSDKGCKDTVGLAVVVNALPIANAGLDQSICPGFNANLVGAGGSAYDWNNGAFNTSSITVSPAATTSYTLVVTDGNGCTNSDVVNVIVNPVPIADAGVDQSICFGESATVFASGGTTYVWNPGNVNTSNYNLTPSSTGTYTVTVGNQFGCISTDQVTVQVNPLPVAAFASSGAVCEGNSVAFTDQSNITTGTIANWNWNFGNNISSSNQNPSIPYSGPGTYSVNLIINSDKGCKDTITQQQIIWATPIALFTNSSVCLGLPVDFTDHSSISDASALNYSWTFGDGGVSSASSTQHIYASEGGYPIALTVSSQNGCSTQFNGLANVFPLPSANFVVASICQDDNAQFVNSSTLSSGTISTNYWTFGDNGISSLVNPSHTYSTPGDFPISLLISSDHGCLDSTIGTLHVKPKPQIDFNAQNVCQGFPVNFSDLSDPVVGAMSFYQWNFGDGQTTQVQDPIHVYNAPGWYSVSLTASNDSGCSATLVRPNAVNIFPSPVAAFSSNENMANDFVPLVNFTNESINPGFFYWSFGDGDTAMQYSPTHIYPNVGQYLVNLITIDVNGCVDSLARLIEIKPISEIYIPNAFTPNGDTKNDIFQVYTHNVKDMFVQIYDRWGLKIWEWNDIKGGWDGRVNGTPAQSDVYVYRVSTVDVNENREVRIGHVSLVR